MMDNQRVLTDLLKFDAVEAGYRRLYLANPYIPGSEFPLIHSWAEFVAQYQTQQKQAISIPTEPLSDIAPRFYENQFFAPRTFPTALTDTVQSLVYPPHLVSEIVAFKHLRYLPAFEHSLEFVKITYVVRGCCHFYLHGSATFLPAGSLIIVCPNINQAFFVNDDDSICLNIIMRRTTFEEAFSPLLMESNQISDFFWQMLYVKDFSDILYFPALNNPEIEDAILHLYEESQETCQHQGGSVIIMNSYVMLLFGQLIRHHLAGVQVLTGQHQRQAMPQIVHYISENKRTVTLPAIAKQFHLSKGYLSRYIKRETGYSFSTLLQKLRLKEAARLLSTSDLSVEEIIERVGYSDLSHFYRVFKATYGQTPGDFRAHEKSIQALQRPR
ncbi:AraC family transcriptional regulator [Schleiferilactobacillus harbinensis]|uniref:Helix-turn-helix domain-containing protein n=1 Tax=Schleiferilactobacillus harbinensis TaxID=304207 RepID=A0A5P8M7Y3_9LACO|nr:AraC family transcriptional regulator [Schleiferilactobacillus harbinensis]QFR24593.1 helix-turn-helix domain-containing protein [Schleiferilactobacillus harbinensis]